MVELWGSDLETTYHLGLLKIIIFHFGDSDFSEVVIFSLSQFSFMIVRISQFLSSDLYDSIFWLFRKIWPFWINDTILRRDSHFEFCRNGIICIKSVRFLNYFQNLGYFFTFLFQDMKKVPKNLTIFIIMYIIRWLILSFIK